MLGAKVPRARLERLAEEALGVGRPALTQRLARRFHLSRVCPLFVSHRSRRQVFALVQPMGRTNDRRPKKPRGPACGSYVIFDRAYVRRPIEEQPAEREIRITSFSGSDAMRRPIAAVLAGLLLLPQLASGQALLPGARVRFSHPGEGTRTGTVVAFTADTLEVRLPDRAEPAHLPLDQVTRLDVSRGMRRQPLTRAGIGLLVGGALGAAGGFAMASDDCGSPSGCANKTDPAILVGLGAGVVGGMLGLLSGAIPSERWERVSLEPRRVSVVAPSTGNGQGVGLRLAF